MAHKYISKYLHNNWCRHPRPNRPFGHCLIPPIYCPVTLYLAWCLVLEEKDKVMGEIRKVKVWVGILKGPRKRVLCSLMKARELPSGTHLPWVPTMCTALLYKLWGRRWKWTPPERKPNCSTKQTNKHKQWWDFKDAPILRGRFGDNYCETSFDNIFAFSRHVSVLALSPPWCSGTNEGWSDLKRVSSLQTSFSFCQKILNNQSF